jgi:hypothetical protein
VLPQAGAAGWSRKEQAGFAWTQVGQFQAGEQTKKGHDKSFRRLIMTSILKTQLRLSRPRWLGGNFGIGARDLPSLIHSDNRSGISGAE